MLGGGGLLLVLAFGLLHVHDLVNQGLRSTYFRLLLERPGLWSSVSESGDLRRILDYLNFWGFLIACVVAGVCWLWYSSRFALRAIGAFARGAREQLRPFKTATARVPKRFSDETRLHGMLREGLVEGLYEDPSLLTSTVLFGKGAMFATPAVRADVERNAGRLSKRAKDAAVLVVLAVTIHWGTPLLLTSEWLAGAGEGMALQFAALQDVARWSLLLLPIAGLVLAQGGVAGIEYLTAFLLVPREEPPTRALAQTRRFEGFGHPRHLVQQVPEMLDALAWNDFPNRVSGDEFSERGSEVIDDSGSFSKTIFIEQQPRPISDRNTLAATIMLWSGWALELVSAAILFTLLLPFPVVRYLERLSMTEQFLLAPLYVLLSGWLIALLAKNGARFVGAGERILESQRFLSESVLMDIEGTLSRSNLIVGKATDETIESNNLVVRSDFTVSFWAARILSECRELGEKRTPLSVDESAHSRQWVETLIEGIETLRSAGVRPIGADVGSPELRVIVEANRRNTLFKRQGDPPSLPPIEDPILPPSREESDSPPLDPDGRYIDCPDCAEPIRARARICRFCGLELHPATGEGEDRTG